MKQSIATWLPLILSSQILLSAQSESNFQPSEGITFRSADIISEGTRMAAEVFAPADASEKLPTIVMSHGWGGTATHLRPDGVPFAQAGFLVVTFDYRGHPPLQRLRQALHHRQERRAL